MDEIRGFFVEVGDAEVRVVGEMIRPPLEGCSFPGDLRARPAFEWRMAIEDLARLDHMLTSPGCCVRGVRVAGLIDPDGLAQPVGAVRARQVAVWSDRDGLPSCRLLIEAVCGSDPSEDEIRNGYSVTLLDLGPEGWRHLRNVVAKAADAVDLGVA